MAQPSGTTLADLATIRPEPLRRFRSGRGFDASTAMAAVGLCALLITLLALSANGLFIEVFMQDLRFQATTAASLAQHGAPHDALIGPVGQVNSWPYLPFIADGEFSAKDVLRANLLVAWIAAAFSLALLVKLARPWALVAISLIAFLVACSPRENMTLYDIGHLAPYNRWGWALVTPLAFYALVPKPLTESMPAWRAVLAGIGLFLLLFLKVTYFVAAFGVMGAAVLLGLLKLRWAILSMVVCAVGAMALELATGSVAAYFRDISAALASSNFKERAWRWNELLQQGLFYGTVFVVVLWLFQPVLSLSLQRWWRWILEHFRAIAAGAMMIGAALSVLLQNHHPYEAALLSASPFLALAFAARSSNVDGRLPAKRTALVLVCLIGLVTPALDVASLVRHSLLSHRGSVGIAALADTPWRDLRVPKPQDSSDPVETEQLVKAALADSPKSPPSILYSEAARMAEAVDYLRRHTSRRDIVFSYYFADEFPLLLGLGMPRTTMQWWDYGRTFSEKAYIDPYVLFANTTIFLQPKIPAVYENSGTGRTSHQAWRLYGDHIKANFTPTDELRYWRIWRRTDSAARILD